LRAEPGQSVQVPVRAKITGEYPLRVLMLNLAVEPLDGSPALPATVQFIPAATLGTPALTSSQAVNDFAGAWLDRSVGGLIGDAVVGYLQVAIPTEAKASAAYRIRFEHASGSPTGLGLFPKLSQDGLITLGDRSSSSLDDGIPDMWRLRHFGSVLNVAAQSTVDADGDGASNWSEFKAGTDPVSAHSRFQVVAQRGNSPLVLRWSSAQNKSYTVESASSLFGSPWTVLSSALSGTGQELQFTPVTGAEASQFFRVRISE
jgi:hypothetical protein